MSVFKWDCFAGGTFAASDKNSWQCRMIGFGTFHIDPVSSPHNVEQHRGYSVRFTSQCGRKDIQQTGLWGTLVRQADGTIKSQYPLTARPLVNLQEARKICREWFAQHPTPEYYDWANKNAA